MTVAYMTVGIVLGVIAVAGLTFAVWFTRQPGARDN